MGKLGIGPVSSVIGASGSVMARRLESVEEMENGPLPLLCPQHLIDGTTSGRDDGGRWEPPGVKCCCTALHEQLVNALHQAKCSGEDLRSSQLMNFTTEDDAVLNLFKCLYRRNNQEFKEMLSQSELSSDEISTVTFRNLTLLQYACYDNQLPAVELLLERNVSVTYPGVHGTPPLVAAAEKADQDLLRCLIERAPASIDIANPEGETALHVAARRQNMPLVQLLLRNEANANIRNRLGLSPFPGNVLKGLLNQCVVVTQPDTETQLGEPIVQIEFDFLDNLARNSRAKSSLAWLLSVGDDRDTRELLTHPLPKTLLAFRWQRVRYWHYTYLLLHILFVVILNSCIYVQGDLLRIVSTALLVPIWIFWLVKETLQMLTSPRDYIRSRENYLDLALLGSSFIAITSMYLWTDHWLHQEIELLAIFTSFGKLVQLTGRVPRFALQIEIFKRVSQSCLHVLAWYFPVIAAFTLAFRSFFDTQFCSGFSQSSPDFCSLGSSFYRTLVMVVGEFDGSTIDAAPWLIRPLFLAFVFCVVLVMFNVLIGLAVSDTRRLRTRADLFATRARVQATWAIEQAQAKWCRWRSGGDDFRPTSAILVTAKKTGNNLHLLKDSKTDACLDARGVHAVLEILAARTRGSNMNRLQSDLAAIKHNLDSLLQYFKNNEQ